MATVIAGMTTSLDGFVADARGSVRQLYPDLDSLRGTRYMDAAKGAAGRRAVQVVGGASVVQALLRAGLVDELRIDVMPVLLRSGLRLLEKISVQEVGARTSLRFRVGGG